MNENNQLQKWMRSTLLKKPKSMHILVINNELPGSELWRPYCMCSWFGAVFADKKEALEYGQTEHLIPMGVRIPQL